jgi:excisionase family DNA binding protein
MGNVLKRDYRRYRAVRDPERQERARVREERWRERRVIDLTLGELVDALQASHETTAPIREVYVSAEELGSTFGVRPDTVRKWVTRGGCPHFRFGRQIRFNVEQVRRWCEERAEAAGSWTAVHAERAQRVGTVTTGDEGEG